MLRGLGIQWNKKLRWRDKGTGEITTTMWFGLLHVGAVVRLRKCVEFVKKEKGCLTWRGYRIEEFLF